MSLLSFTRYTRGHYKAKSHKPFVFLNTILVTAARLTVALVTLVALLSGCASKGKKENLSLSSEEELYQSAQKQIRDGGFGEAIKLLQTIEAKYPFGEYSKSAQLSLIYAYYAFDEPTSATATANRFIRLHPQYPRVDYAYYMKGIITFPEAKTLFQRTLNVDLSKRDISEARLSFNHFSTLVNRFPNSEYSPDALKRMEFLRNILARHEIHVANYYFERKAYLAAANRGRYVLENFQQTPSVPDALAVMVEGYHRMGMKDLAANSIQVLQTNYPDHPALKKDGQFNFKYSSRRSTSWLDLATLGLISSTRPLGFNSEEQYSTTQQPKKEHTKGEGTALKATPPTKTEATIRQKFGKKNGHD